MIAAEPINPPEQGDSMSAIATAIALEPNVTVCPPGKRAGKGAVLRGPVLSDVPLTTATALATLPVARLAPPSSGDRRSVQERVEAAERAEAMSVALAQPHRDGIDDKMLVEPLGVFCRQQWPPRMSDRGEDLNSHHRNTMYRSGQMYAEIVHQHRVLIGLGSGGRTDPEGGGAELSDADLREKCAAARVRRENANGVLRGVFSGAIGAMVRVAVDEMAPTPYQEDLIRHCLWVLAVHFGILKNGINFGR